MDYQTLTQEVVKIAEIAGDFIMKYFHKTIDADIRFKDKNDLVSFVDIQTEHLIIEKLEKLIPGSLFLAEESSVTKQVEKDKFYWIIDPLDGTTNFLHSIPVFCVSIALWKNDEFYSGVVYDPVRKECFYSFQGGKSYLNDQLIYVSENNILANAMIATGFPYKLFEKLPDYMDILSHFLKNSRGVRRLGSAAIDLVYTACGRFDAFYEYNLNPWDVAAGAFIVQNAGGKVTDFNGGNSFLFGDSILASCSGIYKEVQQIIQTRFY